jgi:hypothetical protein
MTPCRGDLGRFYKPPGNARERILTAASGVAALDLMARADRGCTGFPSASGVAERMVPAAPFGFLQRPASDT